MHVGHTAIFQNPNQAVTDYQIYQEDMALAKECADLGYQSVWGIEHHFTDYIMNPNVTQFLSYMAGYNPHIKVGSMVVVMPWYPAIRIAAPVSTPSGSAACLLRRPRPACVSSPKRSCRNSASSAPIRCLIPRKPPPDVHGSLSR